MRFWDVPTDDVLLMAMHGIDLADDAKMVPFLDFAFGGAIPGAYALATAQTVIEGGTADVTPLQPFGFPAFLYGPDLTAYEFPGIPAGTIIRFSRSTPLRSAEPTSPGSA